MSNLSLNPQAKLVADVAKEVSADLAAAQAKLPSQSNFLDKAKLDSVIDQAAGGLTSGLNAAGVAGAIGEGIGSVTSGLGKVVDTVTDIGGALPGGAEALGSLSGISSNLGAVGRSFDQITGALGKLTGGDLAGGVLGLAGGISSAAGSLNDLLSLKRGANLPAGGELFTTSGQALKLNPASAEDWRVRISCPWSIFNPLPATFTKLKETGGVVFPILPTVNFRTSANYNTLEPVHSNYPFLAYKNSKVEQINISGDFICETELDAAYWTSAVAFFRTMTKMFYGEGDNAGNPPPICQLNGYGAQFFNNIPVIVNSFSVDMPNDVNYVRCAAFGEPTWVPIKSTLNVEVTPIYNRSSLRKFNLSDFGSGKMVSSGGGGFL